MQGEYRGDFTRDTFNPFKHFSRVLMQQGRVQLDADWNEQNSILLYYLRMLAADLIGPHGGPAKPDGTAGDGFMIVGTAGSSDFSIGEGHYYVHGILCENERPKDENGNPVDVTYLNQSGYPLPKKDGQPESLSAGTYLVYLDVWERHVTYVEDEDKDQIDPSIREVALGGFDTTTRAKVAWQVKVKTADSLDAKKIKSDYDAFRTALGDSIQPGTGQ
jgi:hypothetical protein